MQLVKARFGLVGIGCIVELLKTIYHEGYSLKWDDDTRLLFAADNHIDEKTLDEIVCFSVSKSLFHRGIFDKLRILTSSGIQKRWLKVVKDSKRSDNMIDRELDINTAKWFTPEETPFTPEETPHICGLTPGESTHIILDKSIEKNIREDTAPNVAEPAKPVIKSVAIKPEDPLYKAIFDSFILKAGAFSNYPKEAQAIKRIISYCKQHAPRYTDGDQIKLAGSVIKQFYEMTANWDKFWRSQPFTPSALSSLFDRVLVEIKTDEERMDIDDTIPTF